MSMYRSVVLAIDPLGEYASVIQKAKNIVAQDGIIEMIYVWDETPVGLASDASLIDLNDDDAIVHEQENKVKNLIEKIANKYDIAIANTHVLTGSAPKEIRNFAKQNDADCIVIGSHGRHGIALLLGSTASSVVHGTPCDILVVKISK